MYTTASGTYEQQLRSEITKKDAPTIFQVNGPVGYSNWSQHTADMKNSEIYSHLSDKSLAIMGEDGGVYCIPFAIEGYGMAMSGRPSSTPFWASLWRQPSCSAPNTAFGGWLS